MTWILKFRSAFHLITRRNAFFENVLSCDFRTTAEAFRGYRKSGSALYFQCSSDQIPKSFGGGPCPSYATNYGTILLIKAQLAVERKEQIERSKRLVHIVSKLLE